MLPHYCSPMEWCTPAAEMVAVTVAVTVRVRTGVRVRVEVRVRIGAGADGDTHMQHLQRLLLVFRYQSRVQILLGRREG